MFSISIGQAVQILVGFLVGSRQPEEAYRRTLAGLWFAIAITLVVAGIAAIFRETFLGLFTRDAEVIRLGGTLLLIALLLEPFRAFNIILGGALRGAGDYQFPILIGVVSMWGVSVALSYYLGIYWALGVAGVWFAFATDEGLRGLLMLARWRSRIWERKAMVSATE
jgi:Na+-driven multidrug efflux pump